MSGDFFVTGPRDGVTCSDFCGFWWALSNRIRGVFHYASDLSTLSILILLLVSKISFSTRLTYGSRPFFVPPCPLHTIALSEGAWC